MAALTQKECKKAIEKQRLKTESLIQSHPYAIDHPDIRRHNGYLDVMILDMHYNIFSYMLTAYKNSCQQHFPL